MLIYIDTNILLVLSKFDKSDKDVLRLTNKTLIGQNIRILQIILSEVIIQIINKIDDDSKISEYVRDLKDALSKLNCISKKFPITKDNVIECARKLQEKSDAVSDMDSLILAHLIMDKKSIHFYTKDKALKNYRVK